MSRKLPALACACVLVLPAVATAETEFPRFYISAGALGADFDSKVEVNGELVGTNVDLEDDLNFDTDDVTFLLQGYWRFAPRHRVRIAHYSLDRSARATLEEEIVIDDVVYPVNAQVESGFDADIYQLAYAYSILQGDSGEFALTLGLHWPTSKFYIRGEASLVGEEPVSGEVETTADSDVPLPVFGLDGSYRLNDWLELNGRAQYFGLEWEEYDGSFVDAAVALEAWPLDWLGVGLAYGYTKLNVKVDDPDWNGELDYTYDGPRLYLAARF